VHVLVPPGVSTWIPGIIRHRALSAVPRKGLLQGRGLDPSSVEKAS